MTIINIILGSGITVALCGLFLYLGQYKEKILNNKEKILSFENGLKKLSDELKNLNSLFAQLITHLKGKDLISENVAFKTASPLTLTETGRGILQKTHFEDFFKANKEYLFSSIEEQNPKFPFDVQRAAESLMLSLDIDKTSNVEYIKDYVYQKGEFLQVVLLAFAIEIRDRYLKERFKPSPSSPSSQSPHQ